MNERRRIAAGVILLLVVVIVVLVVRRMGSHSDVEASGTVEATQAELGFTVPGRIEAVNVVEGDTVSTGAELARLERTETLARRDQALAQVAAARATLRELQRGARPEELAQARAGDRAAQEKLDEAQRDLDRMRALHASATISQQLYDQANTALEIARTQREQAAASLRLVEAGPRVERIEAARAQLSAAEAAARTLEATLAQMVIRAPFAGVVTVRHHEPGEIVAAGSPAITLLDRADRWVRIYVSERSVGAVRIGGAARITSDSFKGRVYTGQVTTIASEAEFTPKTVQTREERVKLVYAVKVRITGDPGLELKPGTPADVVLPGGP